MHAEPESERSPLRNPLVHYYRECLAAQMQWARADNVLEQKDLYLVPLSREEQRQLGNNGKLELNRPEAIELSSRFTSAGSDSSLLLGALFLVGRIPPKEDRPERRYCAPLLECPVTLRRVMANGVVRIEPQEDEFSLNYSFIGELLGGDEDDLQDRLSELAELVPDFPVDEGEFDDFWNGFQMVATQLPIADKLPPRSPSSRFTAQENKPAQADQIQQQNLSSSEVLETGESPGLDIVSFYPPRIPKDGLFYLLPATAIILAQRAGHPLSALRELDRMTEMSLEGTAFGRVFDPATAQVGEPDSSGDVILEDALPLSLTRTQEAVVRTARTSPLTVITGPPGTGKSYTITAIVLDSLLRGESVLVASQMDKAVQVVSDAVESIAGEFSIVRSGGRAAQRRLAKKISKLTGPRRKLASPSSSEYRSGRRSFGEAAKQVSRLEERYLDVVDRELQWSENWQSFERLLPTSSLPVHEIAHRDLKRAKRFTARARRGNEETAGWIRRRWGSWNKSRARQLLQIPEDWECSVEEIEEVLRLQTMRYNFLSAETKLRTPFPANLVWRELADAQQRSATAALKLLTLSRQRRLGKLLANQGHRAQLRHLATLLRRRRHDLKQKLREKIDPAVILEAFPAWACTTRSLGEILPALPGRFDVVIVDEASQCDPALASVALMRGKRAVVVGDPQQLRHVCFLSHARENAAFASCRLSEDDQQRYRYRRSLFDIASDTVEQQHFFMLDQHFRSHPHIIDFSNHRFYDKDLRIMTRRPSRMPQSAIQVVRTSGQRDHGSSVNRVEVETVARVVSDIIRQWEGHTTVPSIGVVSPFRDHVDAVRDSLVDQFPGPVFESFGIVVGTAHALQGDEKDIIILTTSVDASSHPASLRFLETPNLFNVAITRARQQVIVVTSVHEDNLPNGLLRDYLHHAAGHWTSTLGEQQTRSDFEKLVIERLRQHPLECWPAYRAAGIRIPVVAELGEQQVAVLCDGHPSPDDEDLDPLTAHRILARAGWTVVRIPHRSWQEDWVTCVEEIQEQIRNKK